MDIPNEEYLKALTENSDQFAPYQSSATNDADVAMVVVHFTPQCVVETEAYRHFIEKFSPSTRHLMVNETNSFSGYVAAHRLQWQLNLINRDIFPILKSVLDDKVHSGIERFT
jgi:ribonuclease Z